MEKLSGKTALVTGSTDGVGRLVARKLGQAGARVLVHGRDAERGARVVADIEASGGVAAFLAADLSALAEVRRLADAAQATVDRLDILINNAGIGTAGPRQTSAEGSSCGLRSITSPAFCSRCCYCRLSRTARQRGSLSTVEEGARAILNLATSPAVEGQTGLYFNGQHEAKAQAQAYDLDARRQLQALSLELTGLSAQGVAALER